MPEPDEAPPPVVVTPTAEPAEPEPTAVTSPAS